VLAALRDQHACKIVVSASTTAVECLVPTWLVAMHHEALMACC
jgi:hypothetical protein